MTSLVIALGLFWQASDCQSCGVLSDVASALSEGNSVRCMGYIDKSTPGYRDLEANIEALTAQYDVSASLDVLSESGDDEKQEALVDWFLQTVSKDGTEHVTRRRMRVKVSERKEKGGWKITGIQPASILDPVPVTGPK